jgi:hypothetical protein
MQGPEFHAAGQANSSKGVGSTKIFGQEMDFPALRAV